MLEWGKGRWAGQGGREWAGASRQAGRRRGIRLTSEAPRHGVCCSSGAVPDDARLRLASILRACACFLPPHSLVRTRSGDKAEWSFHSCETRIPDLGNSNSHPSTHDDGGGDQSSITTSKAHSAKAVIQPTADLLRPPGARETILGGEQAEVARSLSSQ